MDRNTTLGLVLAGLGIVGYVIGVYAPYPGRGLTVAGVMIGLTLAAIGDRAADENGEHHEHGGKTEGPR